MSVWIDNLTLWLLDYYLAATVLLALAWGGMYFQRHLTCRMHIAWATSIALIGMLLISVLPGLPKFELGILSAEKLAHNSSAPTGNRTNSIEDASALPSPELPSANRRLPQQHKSSDAIEASPAQPLDTTIVVSEGFGNRLPFILAVGLIVFLAGSAANLCWLGCGVLMARRWRRQCSPATSQWQAELAAIIPTGRSTPELLVSRSLPQAVVLGFWRPVIVLPERFLERENSVAVRQALQHEWAHIAHGDHVLMGLFRVLLPVLYLHPLFSWLRRVMAANQELLADRAVACHSTPASYADNLIRWMRDYGNRPSSPLVTSLGLWQRPRLFSKRISALLEDGISIERPLSRSWKWQTFLMTGCVTLAASALSVRPASQSVQATSSSLRNATETAPLGGNSIRSTDRRHAIAGTVIDDSGQPLAGVLVDAWTWCKGNETYTDKFGKFNLVGFNAGELVQVRFSKAGYSPQMFVGMEAGITDREVALNQATYIEGRIVDSGGVGVAKAIVRANQGPKQVGSMIVQNIWSETKTDDMGHYRLFVQPDRYEVEALSPGNGVAKVEKLLVSAGEVCQLDLELATGATFHATVVDASTGEPAQGVRLWAWQQPVVDATSGESGVVHIKDVPPGKYRLHFESDKYARWWFESDSAEEREKHIKSDGWRREFDPRHLEITAEMPVLKISVEPGVRISGRVVDPDGHAVEGATVAPVRTGTGNSITGDTRYSVVTGADGGFEMLLPASGPANYNLIAHDGKYGKWRDWAGGLGEPLETQPGGIITGVELKLTHPGIVRGRVIDREGAPVANREVFVHRADGRGHRYFEPQATTASDGSFELRHVQPGAQMLQLSRMLISRELVNGGESVEIAVEANQSVDDIVLITSK